MSAQQSTSGGGDPGGGQAAVDQLVQVGEDLKEEFHLKKRVLSFEQYFKHVAREPTVHLRNAATYLRDAFDHFGTYEVQRARGTLRRFRLFDCEFAEGRDRLAGHEAVQNQIYRILNGFVEQGRPDKLILLHGPNGSAKSTCVAAISRALEHYSRLPEGALYRFNWVFPSGTFSKGGIGFQREQREERLESYAHLPEEMVDARLPDELRDHPLLLIPKPRRATMLEALLADDPRELPDNLRFGELNHRNREIFEALLALYQGDFHAVLRHVQVERFFLSGRYRTGLIVVEPKLSVDAKTQQITMDRSIEALPPALQTLSLFRYSGELVDANRGIIEFSDLLKRPVEAFKYLINTVELGRVGLENAILYLDEIFIGSSNDLHLQAFRELPDFPSFKGRLELVRVGYLLDLQAEMEIYLPQLRARTHHVAPHSTEVAALWAILTRLIKPPAAGHSEAVQPVVERMTALEKARLYHDGTPPAGVEGELARQLRDALPRITRAADDTDQYEGSAGASPREIRMLLLNAAQDPRRTFLSPLAVFEEIEELMRKRDVYPYLKRTPQAGGYADAQAALQFVREHYLEQLRDELWEAVGLVPPSQIDQMLARYIDHASNWVKGEKLANPVTGAMESPDEELMADVERYLTVESKESFRKDVMARIAAWALKHPEQRPDLGSIFAKERAQIVQGLFGEREKTLRETLADTLALLEGRGDALSDARRDAVEQTLSALEERFGYQRESAEEAIRHYLKERAE